MDGVKISVRLSFYLIHVVYKRYARPSSIHTSWYSCTVLMRPSSLTLTIEYTTTVHSGWMVEVVAGGGWGWVGGRCVYCPLYIVYYTFYSFHIVHPLYLYTPIHTYTPHRESEPIPSHFLSLVLTSPLFSHLPSPPHSRHSPPLPHPPLGKSAKNTKPMNAAPAAAPSSILCVTSTCFNVMLRSLNRSAQ